MNTNTIDILNQTLIDAINSTKAGVGKGIDFAMEQIPDVCAQLLAWKFAEACLSAVLWILIAIGIAAGWRLAWKVKWTGEDADFHQKFCRGMVSALSALMLVVGVIPLGMRPINTCLKIKVAPKVYLLEYARDLVKGK